MPSCLSVSMLVDALSVAGAGDFEILEAALGSSRALASSLRGVSSALSTFMLADGLPGVGAGDFMLAAVLGSRRAFASSFGGVGSASFDAVGLRDCCGPVESD